MANLIRRQEHFFTVTLSTFDLHMKFSTLRIPAHEVVAETQATYSRDLPPKLFQMSLSEIFGMKLYLPTDRRVDLPTLADAYRYARNPIIAASTVGDRQGSCRRITRHAIKHCP